MGEARIKTRWIILCLALLPFLAQIPRCIMVNTPKFGRIVDATGKGISNVAVIAFAEYGTERYNGGLTQDDTYRIVTRTDADGNYWIPNTWTHMRFAFPWMGAQYHWYITAFKPGYVIAADIPAVGNLDKVVPASLADSPSALWLGLATWVKPIEMHPVTLSLDDAAGYYGYIASSGWAPSYDSNRDEIALRKEGADYFLRKICAIDPDQPVGVGYSIAIFARDRQKFRMTIDDLDPEWTKEPVVGHRYAHHRAKTICNTLKQSWNTP